MVYTSIYYSPVGKLLLASDNDSLIGLWLENQKYYLSNLNIENTKNFEHETILKTKTWLNKYFNKENPNIKELKLAPQGNEFQKLVWSLLCDIPYGTTTTYKELAKKVAKIKGRQSMSSQAIGNAVSHNPISIIIPCHRVVGTNGNLTGYAGGIDKKLELLNLENGDAFKFFF